jgi:protein O-mannosyl-transferase
MKKTLLIVLAAIILAVAVFAFYSSALKLNFLYGDDYIIIKASQLNPAQYYLGNWTGGRGAGGLYRPIVISSVKLDNLLWGIDPFGYHLSNVIFHAVSAFFVFLIAYFILDNFMFALGSGALFAVLPLNAEAVNWICCRCDLIATMFYLAAFYFYLLFSKRGGRPWLPLSIFFFILSLGSKESALTLPLIIYIYEYLSGQLKKREGVIAAYFSVLIPYFIVRYISLGTFFGGYKVKVLGAIAHAVFGYLRTFQLVALPFTQERLLLYFILMPLIILAFLVCMFQYIRKYKPSGIFYLFLLWPLITLLPAAHLLSVGFDFRGARWWYLPSAGISWLIAYFAFVESYGSNKKLAAACKVAFLVFLVYCCFFLVQINKVWTQASDMTRAIRAEAVKMIERHPKGSKICFWNIPDNYKGCYVGMPFLEPPFFDSKWTIMGYQGDYLYYSDISKRFDIDGCDNYVYDASAERFKKVSASYIKKNNVQRVTDDYNNAKRFRSFLKGFRGAK